MAQTIDSTAPPGTRRAQRERRRSRRTRTVIAFAIAALVAASLAAVGFVRASDDGAAAIATTTSTTAATSEAPLVTVPVATQRAITPDDPMRLWIAGDSLAGALGPSLGELTADTGVVQPQFDSRVSSGISSDGVIDWMDHAESEIARLNPEVIVFFIGTNDYLIGANPAMLATYETQVSEMMALLSEGGRPVYWIGAPIMQSSRIDKGVLAVNEVFERVAPQYPSVTYVNAYEIFSNENGAYATSLPDITGKTVRVRADDGIHFTDAGGDHLAGVVYSLIDTQWRMTEQAVPDAPKKVLETQGSSRNPANQGRTVQPAPATTAPRTTASAPAATEAPSATTAPATTAAPTAPTTTKPPTTAAPTTAAPTTAPPTVPPTSA